MPRPVEGHSPYNPGLDGIRAVAVLGVLLYHLGLASVPGGLLGVEVFFVLSGYLITDLLVAEYRRRSTLALGRFWLRRARRLLPALFVMLALSVAWATLFDRSQLPSMRSDVLPAVFYYSNWWYIFEHLSYFSSFGPPTAFSHLWSLAVEEQFYLVWPIALLGALRLVRRRWVLVAGIGALAVGSALEMALLYSPVVDPTRVYDGTDTRAFALLIGAMLALAWPRDRQFAPVSPGARRVLDAAGVAALTGIFVFYLLAGEYDPFVYRGGMVLLSVCTACLIAVCTHPGAYLGRVLGTGPLRWVGERSYGVYLWQVPVIVLTPALIAHSAWRDPLQVATILGLSALSWRLVEQPVRHGALARQWERVRRSGWSSLRPAGRRDWAAAAAAAGGALVCLLGLTGAVSGAAVALGPDHSILPPAHHRGVSTGPPSARTTDAPTTDAPTTTPSTATPTGQGVTAIGDSVMVDAAPDLQAMLPGIVVDAQVGQQLTQVQADVPQLKSQGDIGDELILELGTNGYYSVTQLEGLLRTLGPMKRTVLVNTRETRPWEQSVNQTIATVAASWPDTTLVDWYDASAGDPQYFYPDGVHLDPQGAQAYATMVVQALEAPPPPPTTTTTSLPGPRRTSASAGGRRHRARPS